jgi:hypothetical protein
VCLSDGTEEINENRNGQMALDGKLLRLSALPASSLHHSLEKSLRAFFHLPPTVPLRALLVSRLFRLMRMIGLGFFFSIHLFDDGTAGFCCTTHARSNTEGVPISV